MLTLYSQFLLNQAIRGPLYLLTPPVIKQEETTLPRYSVVHLLDINENNIFPSQHDYYFREVPKGKKLFIHNVLELDRKEDVNILNNKYLPRDQRRWYMDNQPKIRLTNLIESPVVDANNVPAINYNTLKDLYSYKTSVLSEYNRHRNLSETFWNYVKASLGANKDTYQIVPIEVPVTIPGFSIFNRILGFNNIKTSRVITDKSLLWILDLFKWLDLEHRESTPLSSISDEDSERIILEFKYKGYSSFLTLSILRGINEDSELQSSVKVGKVKALRSLIILLNRIQDAVSVQESSQPKEDPIELVDNEEETPPTEESPQEVTSIELNPSSKDEPNTSISGIIDKPIGSIDLPEEDELVMDLNFSNLIDKEEEGDALIDAIFEQSIKDADSRVSSIKPTPKEKDPNLPNLSDDLDDLSELELDNVNVIPDIPEHELQDLLKTKSPELQQEEFIQTAIKNKTLSSSEIRSLRKTQEQRKILKSPYSDKQIDEYVSLRPTDIKFDDIDTRIDTDNKLVAEELKKDITKNYDKVYLKEAYHEDIVSYIVNIEKAGYIIKNYEKDVTRSSIDNYETHKLTLKPLNGKESTIYFRIPVIDEEGSFMASGVMYRMRKLRQDIPIRKISPTRVGLTSDYGKFFVSRTERKAFDRNDYILNFIRNDYLEDKTTIRSLTPIKRKLTESSVPNDYFLLASNFAFLSTDEVTFLLREEDNLLHLDEKSNKDILSKKLIFVGHNKQKDILVMDKNNNIFNYTKGLSELGTIEDILKLDIDKVPRPFSVMKVLGTDIPLGVVLSYYIGLAALLKATKTQYKTLGPRERYTPSRKELVLRFSDHKLVLEVDTPEKELIFSGFLFFKSSTKQYPLSSFNRKDVYLNLGTQRNISLIYFKEMEVLQELFLDPNTIGLLSELKEPTEFIPLLLRANQLLKDFQHPRINDPRYSRIRGYDRVPGLMYRALAEAIREHKVRGRSNSKVSMDPYKVWNYITQDNTVKGREVLNPILTIKEDEAVTLSGRDGISSSAVPTELRRFHPEDMGLTEGTVDSADVAVITYLTPYAKLNGIRGTVKDGFEEVEENPGKVFSTPVQIAPFSERDDCFTVRLDSDV